jgi:hypothetical protein
MDVNLVATKNIGNIKKGYQLKKGSGKSEQYKLNQIWINSGVPEIASSLGMIWGGNFSSYKDNIHFECVSTEKNQQQDQYEETEEQVKTGKTKKVFDETLVFSNFKVDNEIFNFFLRRQQVGYHEIQRVISNISNQINVSEQQSDKDLLITKKLKSSIKNK